MDESDDNSEKELNRFYEASDRKGESTEPKGTDHEPAKQDFLELNSHQ